MDIKHEFNEKGLLKERNKRKKKYFYTLPNSPPAHARARLTDEKCFNIYPIINFTI